MSGNYPHIPPPINMHSVSANKPKNDFIGPPPSVNQWNMSQPNEFENREKYMETQLTEEHYTPCDLDSNANQNEIPDDDPCPPPGLRRLVTGQTVSFDDGPVSPPFDRIVPGEGNTFSNYPQSTKITKPPTDSYNDKRFVSGSTNKDYNSQPYQPFVPPPKKDNVSTYNNNFYNPVENSAFNSSTQDFFDTYLRGNSAAHDVENTSKGNQYAKNKFQGLPGGFQNYESDKRDNYFQSEKLSNIPKTSSNSYADDFSGKNVNHHFQPNFSALPNNHMAVDTKSHKPLENIPYASSENKSNEDGYSENRRPSFDNFGHDQPPFVGNYDTGYNQKHNTIPSRGYAEEMNVESKNRELSNYPSSIHKPDNFQVFDGNYYTVGNTAENTQSENKYSDNQTQENIEKVSFHGRADYERNRKDDSGYNANIGRMAVEGSSDVCYSKPPPSASMQTQSPNYDYWYSNNSQKSFADEHKNTNDQGKLLKEQNSFYANKHRNEKPQNVPLLDTASPRLISPASASSPASANPYEALHSKTQSMSLNTSSLNENLPYQSNENYNVHENIAKRYDRGIKPENMNTSSGPYAHNFRTNENVIDKNKLIGRPNEENFTNDLKQRYPQQNESNHETLKGYESHQNFENISAQEELAENSSEHVSKVNQENYINQDESFVNRDPVRKDMQLTSERSFIDQRKSNNLEVGAGADVGKEVNLKSPYRKNSLGGNEERSCSEALSLERGTVPGAQSTPNDVAPNRSFINANNSSSYSSTNLFQTIEDEEEREETTHYSDSDEKPMNRSRVLGYHSNTIPGPRSVSRKFGRDNKMSKLNKMKPPLEGRMVVGEGSSDVPSTQSNRSRDDGPYEDDKQRHIHPKDKDPASRYERDRKKPLYRREHRKPESDDEDYEDFADRAYDNSPDRESRGYLDKHYRGSPRHLDKRSSRRDRESSFTQSQDESFFDDDDDDYDTYRNRRRYYDRRYPRDAGYKQYGHDSFYREGYRDRRDYYGRYEDESFYGGIRTSRPSSRSGSEYRPGFMDYGNQRYYNRPPYYEYLDHRHLVNFGGGPRLSKREMEYWSKVREMEPQKYMHWYKTTFPKEYYEWYSRHVTGKIMQNSQDNRRGSGHSGQSSVNDANSVVEQKFSDLRTDLPTYEPVERDTLANQEIRCTPAKFTVPHVKGVFNTLGQLVVVNACSPHDGQPAVVDFYQIPTPENDSDFIEFTNFTGPFIVGETHVNTVSDFVRYYANITPHPSAKLLYQLIELIIKQRGRTDGIAISELLMENYRDSQKYSPLVSKEDAKLTNNIPSPSEAEIIEKYTDLLLLGNKNDALEYAVNNKLWGHAFLLASKMGSKHYSKVLAKFDNSISMNNPLKTLYQLYSKQIPQASTACANEKWGDWRPHLAMMLSNPTSDSEFDKQAIITLGDSLVCKDVFAAHFCYLAAETDFEPLIKSSAKYTLLSLRNNPDNLGVNTPNHAILLTQVYEFAKRLQNKDFTINALMPYKYLLATRLVDYGKVSVALQYLESIAMDLIQRVNDQDQELIYNVIELSERLKYSDAKPLEGDLCSDKPWLINLRQLANNNYDNNQISYSTPWNKQSSFAESQPQYPDQSFMQQQSHVLGQQYVKETPQFVQNDVQQPLFINQPSQPTSLPPNVPPQSQMDRRPSQPWDSNFNAQEQRNIMSPDYGYTQPEYNNVLSNKNDETVDTKDTIVQQNHDQYDQPSAADNQQNSYYSQWDQPQQTVSISSTQSFSFFDKEEQKMPLQAEPSRNRKEENQAQHNSHKDNDRNAKDKKSENGNHSGSWLGGIFSKIVRPKNEMKLPDDKNPSIVWSEEHQRWINKNGDDEDGASVIKPPPKASELKAFQTHAMSQIPRPNEIPLTSNANVPDRNKPPSMDSSNIYKRGKGMKAKYVNVLSQSTTPSNTNLPPPGMMDYSKTQVPPNMKLFVPSSDGPSSMPNDLPSNSDNLQARNTNPDTPMFYNPAQYST